MIIQNRDGSIHDDRSDNWYSDTKVNHYYAEVPQVSLDEQSNLVSRIIDLAFDVIGVRHVEIRVRESEEATSRGA